MLAIQDEEHTTVRTPLLGEFPREAGDARLARSSARRRYYILAIVLSIIFITDLANSINKAPLMRVFESIICREYYSRVDPSRFAVDGLVDEWHCKVAPVQEELALFRAWQDFFDYVPGLFLAIPFGMLADRYGRKWLTVLNVTSIWLRMAWICLVCAIPQSLPIRLVWLQSTLGLLGGGTMVASALLMVIITDLTPESGRATSFFYAHAALCASEFLGPLLGSALMNRNPWMALGVSVLLLTVAIPLAFLLPETLSRLEINPTLPFLFSSNQKPMGISIYKLMDQLPTLGFILADYRVPLVLFASISFVFGQGCANLVLQYTSRRYGWSLSQAAYLSSVRAVIMIVALLGILPLASNYLLKRTSFTALRKDILLLRTSYVFVTMGLLIEGVAPNGPLFVIGCCIATIGMGASAIIRSLLSTLVQQDEVGRLFAVMSLIWTAAALVASPVMAELFVAGAESGGLWSGLPFIFGALLFTLATTILWLTNLRRPASPDTEEREVEKESISSPVPWTPTTPPFRQSIHCS